MRMRARVLVVVLSVVAAGCDWWQWGGNAEHRGANAAAGLSSASAPSWVASKVVDLQPTGPVVTANGLAFVQATDRLVAFDPATNGIVWDAALPAGSTVGSAPAINAAGANSTLFVVVRTAARPVLLGYDVDGVRGCNTIIHRCSPIFTANLGNAPGEPTPALVDGGRVLRTRREHALRVRRARTDELHQQLEQTRPARRCGRPRPAPPRTASARPPPTASSTTRRSRAATRCCARTTRRTARSSGQVRCPRRPPRRRA